MNKYIKDGKVAIIYSPGWGRGWSTWEEKEEIIFDPIIVQSLLNNEIPYDYIKDTYNIYINDKDSFELDICWLPIGTKFLITENDGFETVKTQEQIIFIEA